VGAAGGVVTSRKGVCDVSKVQQSAHPFKLRPDGDEWAAVNGGATALYADPTTAARSAMPVRSDKLLPMRAVRSGRTLMLVGVVARRAGA
jgi:hypothetical protein